MELIASCQIIEMGDLRSSGSRTIQYFISASPHDRFDREYLGIEPMPFDEHGNHRIVLLPTTVTPEGPDSYGPTKVSISSRTQADVWFYFVLISLLVESGSARS